MMIVVLRVFPEIVTPKFARAPGLIKRVAKQVILGDPRIYLLKKDCSIHDSPHKINQYTRRPGDQIGSGMFVAKKLVDSFCATAIMGHVHTGSMFTKVSQVKTRDKWAAYTLPTLGTVSPRYAKGRPNAFTNGFGIVEEWPNGHTNIYVVMISDGCFAYGGQIYGKG
jgi:hypothetical protein